ncbi:MAG TPA: CocE/NonD family hydrolase [Actinomycetota bacterium]|nr:CocE/NonD family hydrolase [Actinomycetota bacterium]
MRSGAAVLGLVLAASTLAGATTPSVNAINAIGSVEQVYATGLAPGAQMSLLTPRGKVLYTQKADSMGGLLYRDVPPGTGYRVRRDSDGKKSAPLVVHNTDAAPWDPQIYDQSIPPGGYGYLTTRDGTKLAYSIHPPTSPAGEPGLPATTKLPNGPDFLPPYPTLIEYAGYGYANPPAPESGIAVLANLMGFAVVDVTMRGAGCSGGAFDFFETLQNLDAYDIIETIAHQPWVLGHRVGMIGISYGGISQLFAAQLNPPHLAAIAPLSVIDSIASVLFPGGNLNKGFAYAYAQERQHDAEPAGPHSGQPWAWQQIQSGDTTCAANQVMHGEAADLLAKIKQNTHYVPSIADPLDPVTFVHKIKVPVFMACQWTDEQTGGFCPILASHFTGTSKKWFTFTNGVHTDSLDFFTYNRWYDFLNLYVAHRAPIVNAAIMHVAAPVIAQGIWGIPQSSIMTMPPDPIQALPTYGLALRAFEKLPMIRVLMDNGAGKQALSTNDPGNPYPAYELSFGSWPIPGTAARTWYFGPGGTMSDDLPAERTIAGFTWNSKALPLTDYVGNTEMGGEWGNESQWNWQWKQNPAGTALSYVTAPLTTDTTVIGSGAVYVWVRSSVPVVDLQATITEIRPDGKEVFVQDGFMRSSIRKLSTGANNLWKQPSTLLNPIPSFTAADAAPMPAGRFALVPIPLYYEGHVYRAGSRIRVIIAAPNGDLPIWSFDESVPDGTANIAVSSSPAQPSFLVLPVIPGLDAQSPLPPCGSLRNEPCRPYVTLVNRTLAR